jgi:hypothetical protein
VDECKPLDAGPRGGQSATPSPVELKLGRVTNNLVCLHAKYHIDTALVTSAGGARQKMLEASGGWHCHQRSEG